ncbi:MAG: hypothetical protein IJ258_06980 [Methanobrevibacter sp.]|uniref:hypothetical protein n=1 Tax=Methanobrevibacter sp. TaxID=66852 RepID=UPI0025F8A638|nr:hypothetical protein [Methanobrevibacter sp.]MBQ8017835.1 hypothetical protein [Methanobrevibacter sp.]
MLQTKNPEVERIIQKYGEGFDTIYFDGKADGILKIAQKGLMEELMRTLFPI